MSKKNRHKNKPQKQKAKGLRSVTDTAELSGAGAKPSEEPDSKLTREPVTRPAEEPDSKLTQEPVTRPTEEPDTKLTQEPVTRPAAAEEVKEAANPQAENKPDPENKSDPESGTTAKKKKKWPLIAAGLILAAGLAGGCIYYGLQVSKYQKLFLEGTFINGYDCSNLTVEAVTELLDSRLNDYTLEVWGRAPEKPEENRMIGTVRRADVDLRRKGTAELVAEIFGQQNAYKWFEMYFQDSRKYEFDQEIVFDEELLGDVTGSWEAFQEQHTIAPMDAYISEYIPEENAYRVVPETLGSRMDTAKLIPAVSQALYRLDTRVDAEPTDCYGKAKVTAEDKKLNALAADLNHLLGASVTYEWYGNRIQVGPEQLQKWVSPENGKAVLDEEAVAGFVAEKAKEADPNGNTFVFTTAYGVEIELKCKSGWVTDTEKETEELIGLIRDGAVCERKPVSKTTNFVEFDGTVGDSYVEIDLTNQHLYLYSKGETVLETDFVSGDLATGHRTPEGIYAVTYKTRDRILRGPGYASFVYYWMPFYGGYGMHDATWRSVFGGQIYKNNGSHGCINLPLGMASTVYSYMQTGFPVVCYYYPEGENPVDLIKETGGAAEGEENPEDLEEPVEENLIQGQW